MKELQDHIIAVVEARYSITGVDLALILLRDYLTKYTTEEFHLAIRNLVDLKQIIELEYVTPTMPYRTKSIFFPKGTQFLNLSSLERK